MSEESKERKHAYDVQYMRERVKQITIGFNVGDPDDVKLYDYVRSKPNQTRYLKELIQDDMSRPGE